MDHDTTFGSIMNPMDSLCSICKRTFTSKYRRAHRQGHFPHHGTLQAFKGAIRDGCGICNLLWRSLSSKEMAELNIYNNNSQSRTGSFSMSFHKIEYTLPNDHWDNEYFEFSMSAGNYFQIELAFLRVEGQRNPH